MRLNKRLLFACAVFLAAAAVFAHLFLNSTYRLPVLMYHSINYTTEANNKTIVSPDVFERQMRYLREEGYNVISLETAVRYIDQKKRPPPRTVAVTIDDGYKDNYIHAYPILKKYAIPATIFVITDLVGAKDFMSWDQLTEIAGSKLVEIESHTASHKWLQYLDDAALRHEIVDSKAALESRLGAEVKFLCYPMGGYDERVKRFAREAGYRAAFATKPTRLSPNYDVYEIKRVRISPSANNLLVFRIKISGYHAFFRIIQNDYRDIPKVIWEKRS